MKDIQPVEVDGDSIVHCLQMCVEANTDGEGRLATDHYLCAFNQLIRLFRIFGKGPYRPLRDVPKAIKALEIRRVSGTGHHYRRLSSMLEHEKKTGMYRGSLELMSGSVAVAYIQDAVPYMTRFLEHLLESATAQKKFTGKDKVQIYSDTIGKHYSAWTRAIDKVTLLRSLSTEELWAKFESHCNSENTALDSLRDIVKALDRLHDETHCVVSDYGRRGSMQVLCAR